MSQDNSKTKLFLKVLVLKILVFVWELFKFLKNYQEDKWNNKKSEKHKYLFRKPNYHTFEVMLP